MKEQLLLSPEQIADALAFEYEKFPEVVAVALGGSFANKSASPTSDIDLYVYCRDEQLLSIELRRDLIHRRNAPVAEIQNMFWEPGDEWREPTGTYVDVMYRSKGWMENKLHRVLVDHQAEVGYTTCFWHNILHSQVLFDRDGWFTKLTQQANVDYPIQLQQAIIEKNYPILRKTISSYKNQIYKAVERGDLVSVNHRMAAFLASYFDVVFAINRLAHPGEKRLIELVQRDCTYVPENIDTVNELIRQSSSPTLEIISTMDMIVDGLDGLIPFGKYLDSSS
jgi:predicted nucleotidyltransferase